jgi:hypothetical protein
MGCAFARPASEVWRRNRHSVLQIAATIAQGNATKNVAHKLRINEWTAGTSAPDIRQARRR